MNGRFLFSLVNAEQKTIEQLYIMCIMFITKSYLLSERNGRQKKQNKILYSSPGDNYIVFFT